MLFCCYDIVQTFIRVMYEQLSRITLFLDQARRDEYRPDQLFAMYASDIAEVEHDSDGGIYAILCRLHRVMDQRNVVLGSDVIESVKGVHVTTGSSVIRYARDWIVLNRLKRINGQIYVFIGDIVTSLSPSRKIKNIRGLWKNVGYAHVMFYTNRTSDIWLN